MFRYLYNDRACFCCPLWTLIIKVMTTINFLPRREIYFSVLQVQLLESLWVQPAYLIKLAIEGMLLALSFPSVKCYWHNVYQKNFKFLKN